MNEINALKIQEILDKYCFFTYLWNLKNKTSEQIEQNRKQIEQNGKNKYREQTNDYQRVEGAGWGAK